jgi:hypothetical protein
MGAASDSYLLSLACTLPRSTSKVKMAQAALPGVWLILIFHRGYARVALIQDLNRGGQPFLIRGRGNVIVQAEVRAKVVRLVKREYADFGPTLAAERLAKKQGVVASKESVRQILTPGPSLPSDRGEPSSLAWEGTIFTPRPTRWCQMPA